MQSAPYCVSKVRPSAGGCDTQDPEPCRRLGSEIRIRLVLVPQFQPGLAGVDSVSAAIEDAGDAGQRLGPQPAIRRQRLQLQCILIAIACIAELPLSEQAIPGEHPCRALLGKLEILEINRFGERSARLVILAQPAEPATEVHGVEAGENKIVERVPTIHRTSIEAFAVCFKGRSEILFLKEAVAGELVCEKGVVLRHARHLQDVRIDCPRVGVAA